VWTPCKRLKEIISPRDSKWSGEAQSDYFLELSLRAASFQPSFASCAALPNFLPTTRPALSTSTAALCAACPTLPAGVFASSRRCWGDGLGPQAHSEMKHATKTGRMLFRLLLECMGLFTSGERKHRYARYLLLAAGRRHDSRAIKELLDVRVAFDGEPVLWKQPGHIAI